MLHKMVVECNISSLIDEGLEMRSFSELGLFGQESEPNTVILLGTVPNLRAWIDQYWDGDDSEAPEIVPFGE